MSRGVDMTFKNTGFVEMLEHQNFEPFYESHGVDELLRALPFSVTVKMARFLYMAGFIEGKREERAKKQRNKYKP